MLQTKALYNILRLNAADDPTVKAEPWALEDLRPVAIEELFARLDKSGIKIDRKSFSHFAEGCDTPEELADLLSLDHLSEGERDPIYLLIFELWRRLLPEKQSLSIFCDEMDHRISLYDLGETDSDELIQDALANFLEVLDENADCEADPEEIFEALTDYCAHDLESFIYEYISELLDSDNSLYASELIEGFSQYVSDPLWFDFLRVRLIACTDVGDADIAMHRLLENDLDVSLLLEISRFLSLNTEHELFKIAIKKTIPLLTSQEELRDCVTLIADFYRKIDEDDHEKTLQKLLTNQTAGPILPSDLELISQLIGQA